MTTILLFVGGYFVLLGVLSLAVRPYRLRMAQLSSEILQSTKSDSVRAHIQAMLETAYSIRSAPAQFFSLCMFLVLPAHRIISMAHDAYDEHADLMRETRFADFYELYNASVAAVNPIFGALAYAGRAMFRLKIRSYARRYHADRRQLTALQIKTV